MANFVVIPPSDYIAELLRLAPSFALSVEYNSLDFDDRSCAGFVFSAFGRYMEASLADRVAVDECINAIEHFASTNDSEAQNLLVTEVFEGFRDPRISFDFLLPVSRALYDRWIVS